MRPLMRLLRGEGLGEEANRRFRFEVVVEVEDEKALLDFNELMHVRWFTAEEAKLWRENDPPLLETAAEALILLNMNPPEIGLRIVKCMGEEISARSELHEAE